MGHSAKKEQQFAASVQLAINVAIGPVTQWHVKGAVTLLWEVSTVMVALWVHNVHHPNSHSINCV